MNDHPIGGVRCVSGRPDQGVARQPKEDPAKVEDLYTVNHIELYMVKTTIILDDDLYKELVREALEKYGTTRKLSKLINEKLRMQMPPGGKEAKRKKAKKLTIKLGRELSPEEIEKLAEEGWKEVIGWKRS